MEIVSRYNRLDIDEDELRIHHSTETSRLIRGIFYAILIGYIFFLLFRRFSGIYIADWINFSWVILFFVGVLLLVSDRIIARYGRHKSSNIRISDITTIKFLTGIKEIRAVLYSGEYLLKELTFDSKEQVTSFIETMQKVHPGIDWIQHDQTVRMK